MVNPGCYTGMRLKFMHQQLAEYNKKKTDVDRQAFVLMTIRLFLKHFPVSLGEDEPSEEHLSSIDDSVVEPEAPLPDEGTEEYRKAWEEQLDRAKKEKKRGEQIRRWLKAHHKQQPMGTAHFFWAQENKEAVRALKKEDVEEEVEKPKKKKKGKKEKKEAEKETEEGVESEDESTTKKKSNGVLTSYQALCKSEFEKLDPSEQKEWKELGELNLAHKSEMYTAITKGQTMYGQSGEFAQPVLDVIAELTRGSLRRQNTWTQWHAFW
ncbi:hypothetical protein BT96DRAFT_941599 [Gymnopus androsaceus JB14]|uniref:Uncharacterized protein n=1 Tax=Gymnopus androsaceus JB14 TaxID=1447944 RepID=A0A6A4HDZ8_9AGAR|nr:hypothetical protein BT96DRAFT_941599 [Gymnopus androsaceus JB14]